MTPPHTQRIGAAFKRRLDSYDGAAIVQRRIAERLGRLICQYKDRYARIMELGHGTGFLTAQLTRLAPDEVWLNDLVAPLPRLPWPERTILHRCAGDAQGLVLPPALDLIASSSMLQWLCAPQDMIRDAVAALAPGGLLALSSFGPDNFPELAAYGIGAGAPSYRDAQDLRRCLPDTAQALAVFDDHIPLSFPDARALFAHLRATGVNGQNAGMLDAAALRKVMRAMEHDGAVTLTYRPSYCIARKL